MARISVHLIKALIHQKLESMRDPLEDLPDGYHHQWDQTKDKLDLLDGSKDEFVDESQAARIPPSIVASWDESRAPDEIKTLIREISQGQEFQNRLHTLFTPSFAGMKRPLSFPGASEFTPCCWKDADPAPALNLNKLGAQWNRLTNPERMEALASLRTNTPKKERLALLHLLEDLFPHLKELKQSRRTPEEFVFACLKQLKARLDSWNQSENRPAEIQVILAGTLLYLERYVAENSWAIPEEKVNESEAIETSKRLRNMLRDLYEPALFDTDWDGIVDAQDAFPTHAYYHKDDNNNQIPDELEALGRDPAHFYGLAEGEMRSFGPGDHLVLFRLKNRVTLIVNMALEAEEPSMAPEMPAMRLGFKQRLEEAYLKMMPRELKPLAVRVNFYHAGGRPVVIRKDINRPNMYLWSYQEDSRTLAHELGHHLGMLDRYFVRRSYYDDNSYMFTPGVYELWDPPHLMNTNYDLRLDPVDLVVATEDILKMGSPLKEANLTVADIYLEQGEWEKAEEIYLKLFETHRSKSNEYFEAEDSQELNRQLLAMEGLKGYLQSRLHRYHKEGDEKLIKEIDAKLGWMKESCLAKKKDSEEAAWFYHHHFGRLLLLRKTGEDLFGDPSESASQLAWARLAETPLKDSRPSHKKWTPQFILGLRPFFAQRFVSTGTGEWGLFDRNGERVDPNTLSETDLEKTKKREIRMGSQETGGGLQLQVSNRILAGHGEYLGQAGLLRYQNFAGELSRTEINANAGFNIFFEASPKALHPYVGWRFGLAYDPDHKTLGLGLTPLLPTLLGLRLPLNDHLQMDTSAAFLVDVLPEQNGRQDEVAVHLQAGLGLLYH